jgi:hypothetical protein
VTLTRRLLAFTKGGIGGITHDNGLLAVFSRTRHQVAIFGPAIQTTTNKRRRTSPEPTATSTGNGVQYISPLSQGDGEAMLSMVLVTERPLLHQPRHQHWHR